MNTSRTLGLPHSVRLVAQPKPITLAATKRDKKSLPTKPNAPYRWWSVRSPGGCRSSRAASPEVTAGMYERLLWTAAAPHEQ
jgi:hypothetical protein